MTSKPLEGLKIVDLSHRLPGPLCGKILSDLGAEVIKIEDHVFQDPFLSGPFAKFDSSFISWYENLNSNKTIMRLDFNRLDDQKIIYDLISKSDAVIMGLPTKTREKLKLTNDDLNFNRPFICLELQSSKEEKKSMHDLNALAMTGILSQYVSGEDKKIVDPPFLPIAGISFGHKGATDLLAHFIKASKENKTQFVTTYLDEVARDLLGIFWPSRDRQNHRTKFLHNGLYPCYNLYQTKDKKYLALAAVEEKFWNRFCEIFEIKTNLDRFYHSDNTLFDLISSKFQHLTLAEVSRLIEKEDICLTPIAD